MRVGNAGVRRGGGDLPWGEGQHGTEGPAELDQSDLEVDHPRAGLGALCPPGLAC